MANSMSVKLSLDASGFTSGINEAKEATKAYTNQVSKLTQDLPNGRREFTKLKREVNDVAVAYGKLTKEEQRSAEGRSLLHHMRELQREAGKLKNDLGDAGQQISYFASDTPALDSLNDAFKLLGNGISTVAGALGLAEDTQQSLTKAVAVFTTVQSACNLITQVRNALQAESNIMMGISVVQEKAANAAIALNTAAKSKNIIVSKAAILAQKAFNAVANANPYVLLATAIIGVTTALVAFCSGSDDASESMTEQERQAQQLAEAHRMMGEEIQSSMGHTMSSVYKLRAEWTTLRTEAEKEQWIKNNASSFKQLGLNIHSVADAQELLIKQFPLLVKYMEAQAKAVGIQNAMARAWEDYYTRKAKIASTFRAYQYEQGSAIREDVFIDWVKKNLSPDQYREQDYIRNTRTGSGGMPVNEWAKELILTTTSAYDALNKYIRTSHENVLNFISEGGERATEQLTGLMSESLEMVLGEMHKYEDEMNAITGRRLVGGYIEEGKPVKPKSTSTRSQKAQKERQQKIKQNSDNTKKEYQTIEEELNKSNADIDKQIDQLIRAGHDDKSELIQNLKKRKADNLKRIEEVKKIKDVTDDTPLEEIKKDLVEGVNKLKQEQAKLVDKTTKKITDQKAWDEFQENINAGEKEIKRVQNLIDGIKVTKLEELEAVAEDYKKQLIAANDEAKKTGDYTKVNELKAKWDEANQAMLDYKQEQEELFNPKKDPRVTYIEEQIKQYEDANNKIEIDIEVDPTIKFSAYARAKARKQIQENTQKIEDYKAEKDRIEHPIEVVYKPEVTTEDVKDVAGNDTIIDEPVIVNNFSKIKKLVDSGLLDIKLTDFIKTDEKDLYDVQKDIIEAAQGAIDEVQELYKKGLMPKGLAEDIIKQINEKLQSNGIKPIKIDLEVNEQKWKKVTQAGFDQIGVLDRLVGSYKSLDKVLNDDNADAWEKTMAVINSLRSTYEGVMETLSLFNTMQQALTATKQADTAVTEEHTAAEGADAAAQAAGISTSLSKAGANAVEGGTEAMKSGAKLPFPANIAAIAAGVAAVIAAVAAIKGIAKFESGGVVGGTSYTGDKLLARVNSGEVILNRKQQRTLNGMLDNSGTTSSNTDTTGVVKIKGSDIYLALKNYSKTKSKTNKNTLTF